MVQLSATRQLFCLLHLTFETKLVFFNSCFCFVFLLFKSQKCKLFIFIPHSPELSVVVVWPSLSSLPANEKDNGILLF